MTEHTRNPFGTLAHKPAFRANPHHTPSVSNYGTGPQCLACTQLLHTSKPSPLPLTVEAEWGAARESARACVPGRFNFQPTKRAGELWLGERKREIRNTYSIHFIFSLLSSLSSGNPLHQPLLALNKNFLLGYWGSPACHDAKSFG